MLAMLVLNPIQSRIRSEPLRKGEAFNPPLF